METNMKRDTMEEIMNMESPRSEKAAQVQAGTLYGVGVGPGDPDLVTVKAAKILKSVDVVYAASSTKNDYSIAVNIANAYIPENTPVVILSFPMTRDNESVRQAWKKNAEMILETLGKGKNAAFLTLGDSMTYSTFGYILKNIKMLDSNARVETIPGITSYQAAAASLNMPLVEGEESLMIMSGADGGDKLRKTAEKPDTVVFLKAYKNVTDIVEALNENGRYKTSRGISNISTDKEKIVEDISSFAETRPDYWTLIIAKQKKDDVA